MSAAPRTRFSASKSRREQTPRWAFPRDRKRTTVRLLSSNRGRDSVQYRRRPDRYRRRQTDNGTRPQLVDGPRCACTAATTIIGSGRRPRTRCGAATRRPNGPSPATAAAGTRCIFPAPPTPAATRIRTAGTRPRASGTHAFRSITCPWPWDTCDLNANKCPLVWRVLAFIKYKEKPHLHFFPKNVFTVSNLKTRGVFTGGRTGWEGSSSNRLLKSFFLSLRMLCTRYDANYRSLILSF